MSVTRMQLHSFRVPSMNYEFERGAYRMRWTKILSAAVLGVCFWYAVPYKFPLQLDPDPLKAAANEAQSYQGSLSRQIALPIILLVTMLALYRLPRLNTLERRSTLLWCALSYLGWTLTSVTWSADPQTTLKRLIVFAINALFVYALARLINVKELITFGFACTASVALISLLADAVLLRTFAPLDPDYRFMGVMTANYQAINLFVCLTCGLTLLQIQRRMLSLLTPLLCLLSFLLLLTRARIGTLLFALMLVYVVGRIARERLSPHGRALAAVLVFTVMVPITVYEAGQSGSSVLTSVFMMGRHDTENTASLSNRAPLWAELADSVEDRPLLGYGFEAFWTPERVERISLDQGWVVPHAHNTYLDQTLSLGLVGAGLYIALLWGACAVAWKRYVQRSDELHLVPALLLSWVALLSFTESIPLAPNLPTLIAYSCVVRMCMKEEPEPLGSASEASPVGNWLTLGKAGSLQA